MTTLARINKGATLHMGTVANTLTPIAEIIDITDVGFTKDLENATTHDSGDAEEYISGGTYDTTEVTLQVHLIAGSTDDLRLIAAAVAIGDAAIRYFKTEPKAATGVKAKTFAGFVTSYVPDSKPTKGKQTATIKIKPTGAVTQAA